MQVATVNSIRLHYAVSGDPDGRPLVFANALGTDLRVWDRLLPLLPARRKIVRYDMRGHGLLQEFERRHAAESSARRRGSGPGRRSHGCWRSS